MAQYPTKPVKMIVPFQAGSAPDVLARAVSERLGAAIGQAIVIDNRPGAGGNIGADAAAKAPGDGYTLMLATISHASNPSLYRNVNYDPVKDFAPVSLIARVPGLLVVPADSPIKSVADLVAAARAKPGSLNYASGGNGSQAHFGGELFRQAANVEIVHVPYKGAPEILTSLLSNQTAFAFPTFTTALPQVQGGKLRALAVTSPTRNPKLPEVPTMKEAGVANYSVASWNALAAPAGTPPEVIARLNAAANAALASPAVQERLLAVGVRPQGSTPEQLRTLLAAETKRWGEVIRRAKIELQ